ncbi:hypothetical protein EJ08DRAFT_657597 [Tothia fuscella]|uniref:Uncharacterized protein n=1 Tax=Tothia fuscella TaxID=1048955 RepID=A0A9P4NYA3_9PEZI|nr:hypothetical protein EJ08DRAFT_657597 [Tothia fuscella]
MGYVLCYRVGSPRFGSILESIGENFLILSEEKKLDRQSTKAVEYCTPPGTNEHDVKARCTLTRRQVAISSDGAVTVGVSGGSSDNSKDNSNQQEKGGLGMTDKIALGVGIGIGVLSLIVAMIGAFLGPKYFRKRKQRLESDHGGENPSSPSVMETQHRNDNCDHSVGLEVASGRVEHVYPMAPASNGEGSPWGRAELPTGHGG